MSLTELNSCEYDAVDHGLRHAFEADDDVQVAYSKCLLPAVGPIASDVVGDMSPSGCTLASGVVDVIVVVVGVCSNGSQTRTCKCTCLIFGVSIGLDLG